ncbi:hypothetical protein ACLB1E_01940 [Escherichia coli]
MISLCVPSEIAYIWPQAVEQQVAGLKEEVPEEAKAGRVDLRDLPLVTIDGEDARDFDDAVYCGRRRRLAFMGRDCQRSYYVRPPTPLDEKRVTVARRCTSLRRLSRCCRKCSLTVCARSIRR